MIEIAALPAGTCGRVVPRIPLRVPMFCQIMPRFGTPIVTQITASPGVRAGDAVLAEKPRAGGETGSATASVARVCTAGASEPRLAMAHRALPHASSGLLDTEAPASWAPSGSRAFFGGLRDPTSAPAAATPNLVIMVNALDGEWRKRASGIGEKQPVAGKDAVRLCRCQLA